MTSNIGTKNIIDYKKLGFGINDVDNKDIEDVVIKELEKIFKPELINRIDEKIVFKTLISFWAWVMLDRCIASNISSKFSTKSDPSFLFVV